MLFILLCFYSVVHLHAEGPKKFPEGFLFGIGTSAYQVEGAWNISDKGVNILDNYLHKNPYAATGKTNGDEACDSYHLYQRDVEMIKHLGLDFYRFSISWSRLLPTGIDNIISEDGKRYYNALIDELIKNDILPAVTLYHWDLPQALQKQGGWLNPSIVDRFADYTRIAFQLFGDRVKIWQTFNEPNVFCRQSFGNNGLMPNYYMSGLEDYKCSYNVLLAHAKSYHLYVDEFKERQKGRIGISLASDYFASATNSSGDRLASRAALEFELGWFANPIFSKKGDYPPIMKKHVALNSLLQGYKRSRLPKFTQSDIDYIRGTSDFFGFNHYTTRYVRPLSVICLLIPKFEDDCGVSFSTDPEWPVSTAGWIKVVPWGFKAILKWISKRYNNPEIIIFENGYADNGELVDINRVNYLREYLTNLWEAIQEGSRVIGYSVWTLLDTFEWMKGFTDRFGLYYVHHESPEKTRVPKLSAFYYKQVVRSKSII